MKLSIIIPVYNISTYLRECVQSVLRQTFTDYEIILVDDGSKDNSCELCDQLAHQANQGRTVNGERLVKVIHKENGGLSDARNAGLRAAQGEYIHFLDGDDYYTTNDDLQILVDELERQNNPDVLLFCRRDFYEDTGRVEPIRPYNVDFINATESPTEIFRHLLTTQRFNMSACFQLLRREMLMNYKIFFTKGLISEDVDWSLALWQKVTTVKAINCPAYSYRHRSASISTAIKIKTYDSYDYMFAKWIPILQKQEYEISHLQLSYLAYLYPTLLYNYYRLSCKERGQAKRILRKYQDILYYSSEKKSARVQKMMKYLGFNITLHVFAAYSHITKDLLPKLR